MKLSKKVKLLEDVLRDHLCMLDNSERIPEGIKTMALEIVVLCDIIADIEGMEANELRSKECADDSE